jgi:hypothetical protein
MPNNLLKDKNHNLTSTVVLLGSILGFGIAGMDAAGAVTFGSNLILNPGAELDIGATNRSATVTPANWTTTSGSLTAAQYGGGGAGTPFPTATSSGSITRGANFFAGGTGTNTSTNTATATQQIALSPNFSVIDAGNATFDLSGFFGGYRSQGDRASLTATFQNASSASLGDVTIGLVTPAERAAAFATSAPNSDLATGMLSRTTSGTVPTGTRSILLTLNMFRDVVTYNDGYADNLSLVLNNNTPVTSVPEPSSIPGMSIGIALVIWIVRKQKQKL